ncbi:MAG TPA: nuclear transport factor 2 family protein [Terriglobales bacterium]|jgi:beta-aspartyl-peptidase (threonine type)
MLRCFAALSALALVTGTIAAQTPSARPNLGAETEIQAVLHAQVEAWNRGDLRGFMEGYWKSPGLTFAAGTRETRGWDQVLRSYQARYQGGDAEMGKLSFAYFGGVHVVKPEIAYLDGEYYLNASNGKKSHGVFTLVFRKFPEGWRIIHDRTCAD